MSNYDWRRSYLWRDAYYKRDIHRPTEDAALRNIFTQAKAHEFQGEPRFLDYELRIWKLEKLALSTPRVQEYTEEQRMKFIADAMGGNWTAKDVASTLDTIAEFLAFEGELEQMSKTVTLLPLVRDDMQDAA